MTRMQAGCLIGLLAFIATVLAYDTFLPEFSDAVRWEYRIESPDDYSFDTAMNELGEDGWELVFARRATNRFSDGASYEMIFKRPQRSSAR